MGGDDYYAELDYIEVMERAKEGYEDEAVNIEEDASYQSDPLDHHHGETTFTPSKCVHMCVCVCVGGYCVHLTRLRPRSPPVRVCRCVCRCGIVCT